MTLKNIIVQLYFSLSYFLGFGQDVSLNEIGQLPAELKESSGICVLGPDRLLQINDGGNQAMLYLTDFEGNIITSVCAKGAKNRDWEDLTLDASGNLYIGDFGNNDNARMDLSIYKYEIDPSLSADSIELTGVIKFKYDDQSRFPPKRKSRRFDCEAMIHYKDTIYLFTKNRSKPFSGYTYCYAVPDAPGDYVATKRDSFKTGEGNMYSYWIAGASISDDGDLALLGYDKVWLFHNFNGSNFFRGDHEQYYFNHLSQKEAISYYVDGQWIITDEKNRKSGGKIYEIFLEEDPDCSPVVKDSTFRKKIQVDLPCGFDKELSWEIFDTSGMLMFKGKRSSKKDKRAFSIETKDLKKGDYVLVVIRDGEARDFKLSKVSKKKKKAKNSSHPERWD